MLPVDAGGGADLRVGLEALSTFKSRVDGVLAGFENSPGSAQKVAAHALSEEPFSGGPGFGEAKGLHAQYQRVHERLTTLSKTLALQIEGLRIAVHAADVGFDNLEEEQRRRFWEIQTLISRQQAEAEREKAAADAGKGGKPEQQRSDSRQSGSGY